MRRLRSPHALALAAVVTGLTTTANPARADGDLHAVKHIIIVMQENHSFDNYFGALAYAPGSPYHNGPCSPDDHTCVDGLSCAPLAPDALTCSDSNPDDDGSTVTAFTGLNDCLDHDLNHEWTGSHGEANISDPRGTLASSPNDGFVLVNDATNEPDSGESPTDDETMGFYTEKDIPFYYAIASTFAISDRHFASLLGPTFSNRAYSLAATSFGHLRTEEQVPPPGGYKPITGTILDLLDAHHVSWVNYFSDIPSTASFRPYPSPHLAPVAAFITQAQTGTLPAVSFVDPAFLSVNGYPETDEHPPSDIRAGQFFVAQIVNAVRSGPNWKSSIVFVTYDEHGGFYDHVPPPPAPQGGASSPDGIAPGQCADLSAPPASTQPGGGANCTQSMAEASALCPEFTPTGPYPADCPNFDQLGFRVPFVAVSPFAKPHYVSHVVGDHASVLALIEKRFFRLDVPANDPRRKYLTARDRYADTLEDLFDFDHAPSRNALVPEAPPPSPLDPGCGP